MNGLLNSAHFKKLQGQQPQRKKGLKALHKNCLYDLQSHELKRVQQASPFPSEWITRFICT